MNFSELKSMGLFNGPSYLAPALEDDPETVRLRVLNCSPLERTHLVDEIVIGTPTFVEAFCLLESLIQFSGSIDAPGGGYFSADGGMGKSFLCKRLMKRYPPRMEGNRYIHPVVYVELVNSTNLSTVQLAILEQLNQFRGGRQDLSTLGDKVVEAFHECEVRLLLIDEAQHMWSSTSYRRHESRKAGPVGEWLKRLYNNTQAAIFFTGKSGIEDLFDADDQTVTRWSIRMGLGPYVDGPIFAGVLNGFDAALPMSELAGLGQAELRPLIYRSVKGNLRNTRDLLKRAVLTAASADAPRITREHLKIAHFLKFGHSENPF